MRRSLIASALIVLMSTPVMAAQVYKWVDAQGVTHFGAQPPEGQQATSVNTTIAPAPAAIPAKLPQVGVDEEQQAIDEKVKKEVAAKEAERKQYCEKMRTNLAQLENNPRLREEVNGEVRRLDEDERQKRIAEAKKAIAETCQ